MADERPAPSRSSVLDWIERAGNALPDPATLFLLGALGVMALSQVADSAGWALTKTVAQDGRLVEVEVRATGLLSSDGLYWALSSLVDNFKNFPPLAIVLVGMLGIGLAERTGLIGALLKAALLAVPSSALTPAVIAVGVLSSMALDAGYVVLPPVAAALYQAVGRPPLVGLAAVFAGVSAGFSANLALTALDPLLAGFTEAAAGLLDPAYRVAVTCNWWFMIASTGLVTGAGWAVTAWWVEPRLLGRAPEEGGAPAAPDPDALRLSPDERRGLLWAGVALGAMLAAMAAATWIPGAPLYGMGERFPRWVTAIVPLIFLGFLIPGGVYGLRTGALRSDRDATRLMGETMAAMGPYIVLAFFAAQFIEYFRYSGLGEMLALAGGQLLVRADLPNPLLIAAFVGVVAVANLFVGSMSAKYAFFAPVFVPMFMQVGIAPELTQVAYRIGDSISNVITPLNPYMIIVLLFMQRYVPRAGIGTLVALMLPYALVLLVTWTALLLLWMAAGVALGPEGPLVYAATAAG